MPFVLRARACFVLDAQSSRRHGDAAATGRVRGAAQGPDGHLEGLPRGEGGQEPVTEDEQPALEGLQGNWVVESPANPDRPGTPLE